VAHFIASLQCADQPGIIYAVSAAVVGLGGNILENDQFTDPVTGQFSMRTHLEVDRPLEEVRDSLALDLAPFDVTLRVRDLARPHRIIVMVSETDHCLLEILYRIDHGELPLEIAAVVSNHPTLSPLAHRHGVPFHHIPVDPGSRPEAEARLLELISELRVDLVVLARYMQILSPTLCETLAGRVINIHHSFLPGFKGARPYHQAHDRGVKLIGATAHFVTPDLDEGPIIEQDVARVTHARTVTDLVVTGRDVERRVLARALRLWGEDRVALVGQRTVIFEQ
jgi:formyltetrahydrofolate deformylase